MRKSEDEALKLIELVADNSHHHAAKSFGGWSAPAKEGMLDTKTVEISMLLDKIEKWQRHIISLCIRLRSDQVLMASH